MKIVGADLMSKRKKLWPALALSTSPGEGLQSVWLPTFNQELLNILCGQVGKEPRFHWLSTHPCFPFSTLLMALHLSSDLLPQTSLRLNCFLLENTCSLGFTDREKSPGIHRPWEPPRGQPWDACYSRESISVLWEDLPLFPGHSVLAKKNHLIQAELIISSPSWSW